MIHYQGEDTLGGFSGIPKYVIVNFSCDCGNSWAQNEHATVGKRVRCSRCFANERFDNLKSQTALPGFEVAT